jgi:hypothetical protein
MGRPTWETVALFAPESDRAAARARIDRAGDGAAPRRRPRAARGDDHRRLDRRREAGPGTVPARRPRARHRVGPLLGAGGRAERHRAGRAAGIAVVAFRTSHPEDELEGATVVLDSLADAVARLF